MMSSLNIVLQQGETAAAKEAGCADHSHSSFQLPGYKHTVEIKKKEEEVVGEGGRRRWWGGGRDKEEGVGWGEVSHLHSPGEGREKEEGTHRRVSWTELSSFALSFPHRHLKDRADRQRQTIGLRVLQ